MTRVVSLAVARAALLEPYGSSSIGGAEDTPPDPVIADQLRGALTDEAYRGVELAARAVYVRRLTNRVRNQLSPAWPELERQRHSRPSQQDQRREGDSQPDSIRRVLEALWELREVDNLGDGYWLPVPTRCVEFGGSSEDVLVIGCEPLVALRRRLHVTVRQNWIARTVKLSSLPPHIRNAAQYWQTLDAWLGSPPSDLVSWTHVQLAQARRRLTIAPAGVTEFEVYAPTEARTQYQVHRWLEAKRLRRVPKDIVLCRANEGRFVGRRRYWLGTMIEYKGTRMPESEVPVPFSDLRRLMYGLDAIAGTPTSARWKTKSTGITLKIGSPLPPEERRLLFALGRDRSERAGWLPLVLEVPKEYDHALVKCLAGLSLSIVNE